jgi:hypothetical protein
LIFKILIFKTKMNLMISLWGITLVLVVICKTSLADDPITTGKGENPPIMTHRPILSSERVESKEGKEKKGNSKKNCTRIKKVLICHHKKKSPKAKDHDYANANANANDYANANANTNDYANANANANDYANTNAESSQPNGNSQIRDKNHGGGSGGGKRKKKPTTKKPTTKKP